MMNERILKLVEQARQYAWENETHWSANAEREALFEQKFAELIVQECIKLAEADEDRYLEMGEPDLALAMQNYQAMIKQHFGVKE